MLELHDLWCRVHIYDLEFRIYVFGLGLRVSGSGFMIQGLEFRVLGLRVRAQFCEDYCCNVFVMSIPRTAFLV